MLFTKITVCALALMGVAQAAAAAKSTTAVCTSGSFGKENGDGWNGYCCKTADDCRDDCISGRCDGPLNPKYAAPIATKTKTKSITPVPTSSHCISPNNFGKETGEGWNGYCCKTADDCRDDCIKGYCNGLVNPKYSSACTGRASFEKKKGDGYNGACCKTSDDCKHDCIEGSCNYYPKGGKK